MNIGGNADKSPPFAEAKGGDFVFLGEVVLWTSTIGTFAGY
jgi:hypothetical protein